MKTNVISREQWGSFLKDFSRVHLGQKANLWVCSQSTGLMREAMGLPLVGVTTDRTAHGLERIDIIVGDSPDAHVTHQVFQPSALRVGLDEADNAISLEVDSEDGTVSFIRLATPAEKTTPAAFA